MKTFNVYTASASTGKKLSGYTRIEAESFSEAKKIYRQQLINKKINLSEVEILADR